MISHRRKTGARAGKFFFAAMSDRGQSHVPKRLAPDLFLGDIEAVSADCSLLEALGVRRILIAIPDPTAESDDPFQSALDAAVAAASRLGAEVCLVRHAGKALESGAAPALLRESTGSTPGFPLDVYS